MALRTAKIKVRKADGSYKTITTTYDDSNESLAKKLRKQTIETPESTNTSTISNKKTNTNANTLNSRSRMKESHLQRYNLDGTPKIPIADSITNRNIINLGEKNKLTDSLQNSISQKTGNINQQTAPKIDLSGKSYLHDTGKTYGDYYYDNYSQNKDKKIYVNTKDGSYFLDNNGKYEKLGTGLTSNVNTMTTKAAEDKKVKEAKKQGYKGSQSSQKLEKYLNEVSKKTGFTNEELYTIASDYENGKWKPASSKYAEISSRLNKAGYQGYEVANKINKLKKESTQDINTTITNEVFPQKQIPWYKKIVKGSEAFEDGYDVGDITKTVVATAQDISANIGEGFLGTLEGIADTLQYGTADLMELFRNKAASKAIKNNAKFNSTAAIFGKNEKKEDNFAKGWTEKVDKNSISGQGLDSIAQGVGNIGAFVGASYLTGGSSASSFLTTFSSAYGNTKSNAYQNGASDKIATEAALVSGLSEAISEQFFNKIPGMKTQGWGEKLVGKLGSKTEKYFGTKTGKIVMNILDNSGEGFEEIISDILNATGNNIVHTIDKDYNGNLSLQTDTWLESFVYASITSALVNGGNTVLTNTQKNQILKAYAEENNMTLSQAKSVLNQETQLRADNTETNDLKERTNVEKEKQKQVLNEMKQNTYTADERISIPQEVQQEVKEEVQEEIQEQPKVQLTISERKIDEIIKNVTKDSKIDYTQEEIDDLKKTLYNEVEKLGGKVEEIKQQQNKQEQKTPVKDVMNKQKSVIENAKSFSEQVDDVLKNKYSKRDMLVVSKNTPKILQDIGLSDLPITLTQKHLYTMTHEKGKYKDVNYHNIDIETIKQIPEALSRPLNVLKSDTKDDSIVVVTELSDNNNDIIVASIKIDGKGQISDIQIDTNVMTSAYGKSQNYDYFMQDNIRRGNLLYDIDKGIIKRISSSTNSLSKLDATDRLQLSMRSSNGNNSISDIPKNDSPISINNDTTKTNKSQIAPSKHSMQQNEKNTQKETTKEKNTIDEKIEKEKNFLKISQMSDTKLKETSKTIAEQINKDGGLTLKQRKWVGTSTESEVLDNAISIEDLDPNKIYYTPIGNKTTLDKANKNLKKLGYEESIKYIQNKLSTGERISASDVALSERLIQEAVQKGDMKTAQELIMNTAILGTEYGQTIQALSIIQKLTPEGQLKMLDKIVTREKAKNNKTFEGVEITPEMVEKILKAYNKDGTYDQNDLNKRVEEVKQEIADQLKTTLGEKVDAWRYLSMLGNPRTHIRNIVSNVAMKGAIQYKNVLARTIETVLPIKNRTKTWKKSSKVVNDFAKQKATELREVISGETKYSEKTSIEAKKQIFKTKFLENLYNTNSNLLDVEDWLFSKGAFESTFREYLTAHGITTQQDIDNNPAIVEKAQNYAVEQAQIATFRQYSKIASQINKFERNNKLGGFLTKAVVPFKKTPINIAKAGVNYSPLGLIKNLSYDIIQVKKGNMEASQYIDNLSQGLSGSSIALLGYVLAKAGILKGDDDKDKESKYDSALGNKAYSIKIGDNYYSLSWLSPVGMPLFVGANAYKELEENKNIDMNVVSDMLVSTLNPISEMSLVSGLTETLTSYEGEGSKIIEEIAKSSLKSYVGQFFPTLLSQVASVTDSEKRSTTPSSNSKWKYGEEVLNSIKYKIPLARQTLPTYTDLWGNTQKQADNIFTRAWETFIAPYSRYDNKKKKLDEEIQEVYYKTGNIDVIPGTPNSSITLNKEKYRLSNKEYLQFKKTYGTTANNYIEAIIKNSDYKKATYEDKAKIIDKVYDYALTNAQTEYFKKNNIDMENYGHKSILNKLDMFKEENYSYDDIASYIVDNYYKYKRS